MPAESTAVLSFEPPASQCPAHLRQRTLPATNVAELVATELVRYGHLLQPWCRTEIAHAHSCRQIDIRAFWIELARWDSGIAELLIWMLKCHAMAINYSLVALTILDSEEPFWELQGFRPDERTVFSDWVWSLHTGSCSTEASVVCHGSRRPAEGGPFVLLTSNLREPQKCVGYEER